MKDITQSWSYRYRMNNVPMRLLRCEAISLGVAQPLPRKKDALVVEIIKAQDEHYANPASSTEAEITRP